MKQKLIAPPFSVSLKEELNSYLRDPVYMILLSLTAIGSYGFLISHYSVSIDDLMYDYYYYGGLFSQGRFTGSLVTRLFHLTDNFIWIQDFTGIVFLCFSAILLCAFLDLYYKTKNHIPQILFSCLVVSYPLHASLFAFGGCSLAFGVGLTMAVCALFLIKKFFETHRIKYLFLAVIPLVFAASWYESVLVIYVQVVLAALFLLQIGTKRLRFSELLTNGFVYALPFTVAIVLEAVLSKLLMAALRIQASDYTVNQVNALDLSDKTAFFDQLNFILIGNYLNAAIRALFFAPMIVFGAAFLILFFVGLVRGIRQKNIVLFLTCFGLVALNFALPLFMGNVIYRTCQSFAFTVAFAAYYIYDSLSIRATKKHMRVVSKAVLVGLACLIFGQTAQINGLFTTDDLRYQQERDIIVGVGNYMLEHDLDNKPIVFSGRIDFNESVKSRICVRKDNMLFQALLKVPHLGAYCEGLTNDRQDSYAFSRTGTICLSYINHAIHFSEPDCITLFFRFCGFDTVRYGTKEQQDAVQKYAAELPSWPHPGAVKDMGDYVIVNLGESTMDTLA